MFNNHHRNKLQVKEQHNVKQIPEPYIWQIHSLVCY